MYSCSPSHFPLHSTAASYSGWNTPHPRWHLTRWLHQAFPHLKQQISAEAKRAPHIIYGTKLTPTRRSKAPFTRREFNAGRNSTS